MKPITVYTVIPPKHTASAYYRLQVPLETAELLGLPVRAVIDPHTLDIPEQERIKNYSEADIVLLYQPIGDRNVENIRGLQSFIPSRRDGEWKWPPSVIIETDDDLFHVNPLNQAYKSLGFRDTDGNDLPPGHHIGVVQDGERKVLYSDGENGFSIARNRHNIACYRKLLSMADAVQCSTAHVRDEVIQEVSPRRTRVFPNLVRFDHYEQVDLVKDPGKIKILWQGGIAHYEDWYPLKQALGNITKKYPQVHWVIWGAQFPWVKEQIPAHRYTFKDWCPYHEYKLRLAMVGHDISIAPLADHRFNRCRSAIKWYEASVLKHPAATVAQNTGPYRDEIEDGQTGLLFNNPQEFEDKLSLLIENEVERKRLAGNAKQWVSENRDAMKEVPKMVRFWEEIRADRRMEQPHVTDEQWAEIEAEAEEESRGLVPAV